MNQHEKHENAIGPHRWRKGEASPNPKGRPLGGRQRLSEQLLSDIAETWAEHGKTVLTRLVAEDPAKFASLAFAILPRDVLVKVEQAPPGNLDPDSWATLRSVLDLIARFAPDGAEPGEVFALIEDSLRSAYATPVALIEHQPAIPPPPC